MRAAPKTPPGGPDVAGGTATAEGAVVGLRLAPTGRLLATSDGEGERVDAGLARAIDLAFGRGSGHGLLELGARHVGTVLPAVLAWWRDVGARFVAAVCGHVTAEDDAAVREVAAPDAEALDGLVASAPPMPGGEYLTADVLRSLWTDAAEALEQERAEAGVGVQELLRSRNPAWNLVGRVTFHLAENRRDVEAPFAFLATYTRGLSSRGTARHVPLGEALQEYAGARNRPRLLSLLLPVEQAAKELPWLREMADDGDVYHPLRWTPAEALRLLRGVPALERAGIVVRMPAGWRGGRPPRPTARATLGDAAPAGLGTAALLDFDVGVTLDGEALTPDEVARLLRETSGLAMIRGRWVEVDPDRLGKTLDRFRRIEALAKEHGLPFSEAARLLAGADLDPEPEPDGEARRWGEVVAGGWLAETLRSLRGPEGLAKDDVGAGLRGSLRPYQEVGVRWLRFLARLGLGACLADDMGLGKTVQVLALLLVRRREVAPDRGPSLLVAPTSLLANWAAEAERFAPSLRVLVAHPSATAAADLRALDPASVAGVDLVVTSYGSLLRRPFLAEVEWDLVVLDEAQAIKNPGARQTRAAKRLRARARIVCTGTPVENRLGDLWSLLDFLNPGLLGSAKEFDAFARRLASRGSYAPLRDLVAPYVLRRLKTDRSVIRDLPEKTEVRAWCALSRKQVVLYQETVGALAEALRDAEGMARRGLVLASILRLKQICNHPSQWLGDGEFREEDSGKWARLREVVEVVASRQEKALVFTQFRELTAPLAAFLGSLFGRPGLVLHGGTPVAKRRDLVRRFQEDESVPFFVLSLKAGGSGLNLTAGSHVIHVDRWWNPAVEDQATDRAFRIGQTKNVLVHKFVCRGTVEERIDALIESKTRLSRDVLEGGAERLLTEMPDDELLRLVALDVRTAAQEE